MTTTIKIKRSSTTGNVPTLAEGEFATNLTDKRVFTANTTAVFDAFQNTTVSLAITNSTGAVLFIGNTVANAVINSSAIKLTNSTSNVSFLLPTAAERAENRYLKVDGTWSTVTASAAAGGSNTHVQFNDSTAASGTSGFIFDKVSNNVTISNTLITKILTINESASVNADALSIGNSTVNVVVNSISTKVQNSSSWTTQDSDGFTVLSTGANNIPAPASNSLTFFAKYKAGRILPIAISNSGWDTPLQPHIGHNPQYYMSPAPAATTIYSYRMASANTIAFTARTPASTNAYLSFVKVGQTTGATAGTSCSWRNNTGLPWWRGNAADLGGFYAVCRFGVATTTTNGRFFIGFKDSTTVIANGNPSAQTNIIGFGRDSGASNVYAMSANATVANTIDTTLNATTGNTHWYEGVIFAPPNGGTVQYQLTNLSNGAVAFGSYNQTNLPSTTTFLTWQFWNNNGADAAAFIMDWGGVTIETIN